MVYRSFIGGKVGKVLLKVRNLHKGTFIADRVQLADTFWRRLRGLLGKKALGKGEGLLISPASAIHTFFMAFPIDVAFLDEHGQVVRAHSYLPPFRIALGGRRAKRALELPAGTLAETKTQEGDLIVIEAK